MPTFQFSATDRMGNTVEGNISADAALFSAEARLADPSRSRTDWPHHATARWEY